MRFVQVQDPERGKRVGYVDGDDVFDLTGVDARSASSTLSLLVAGRRSELEDLINELLQRHPRAVWRMEDLDVPPGPAPYLLPPIDAPEIWAAGLTYERSRDAREAESLGHRSFYTLLYEAERPELFIKTSSMRRVSGPNAPIGMRTDSSWTVPEPELAIVIGKDGEIFGYTLGNDVSARDIEGENPLYLPQAKVFRGCCAVGPVLYVPTEPPDWRDWEIELRILDSEHKEIFSSRVSLQSMRRGLDDLLVYLHRDNEVAPGTVLMTGTGIVPADDFSLQAGQIVEIAMDPVGILRNPVLLANDPAFDARTTASLTPTEP